MVILSAGLELRQSYQLKTVNDSTTSAAGENQHLTRAKALLTALLLVGIAGVALQAAAVAQSETPAAKAKSASSKSASSKAATAKSTTAKPKASADKAATKAKTKTAATAKDKKADPPKKDSTKKESNKKDAKKAAKSESNKSESKKQKNTTAKGKATPAKGTATVAVAPSDTPPAAAIPRPAIASISSDDVAKVKEAIAHARAGRAAQATSVQQGIRDSVARKLTEWAILRSDNNSASSARYIAFINSNPSWPSIGMMRRRAESMMWTEQPDHAVVLAYFTQRPPLSAKGRFALARALLAQGDRAGAQARVREAWRNDAFGADLETKVLETFNSLLTADDHKARMNMRLYAEDTDGGLRNANRAGGDAPAIAKARVAVIKKAGNAKAALDAVPSSARRDLGYIFSLAQWLRRNDREAEAGDLILAAPRDGAQTIDTDQWWIERRLAARNLLDLGDATKAYRIARDASVPERDNYRVEHEFTAGWIALRFLNDPATALTHFARIPQDGTHTISLARGYYWMGRTYEAQGRTSEARKQYQAAAQYPTAYYGQLAGARLGLRNIVLRSPPSRPEGSLEIVRAMELLYATDHEGLVAGAAADLGDRSDDAGALAAIGEIAARNGDARAMLLLGKAAVGRGLPLDNYAFPTIGMPNYTAVGPAVDKSLVYAIARQESTFNQKTVSSARAMGLMQVTPAAGKYVSRKFNVKFNEKKLLSDPVYNVQLGAAELGDLLADFRGSYVLTFVGYNAGRGRIRDWVARYGDPRDPKVDPIDWVERIPFSETRNYVQRVMENMQVYRIRFGGGDKLMIEADLRRGTSAN
jgi:soluble lytic murein transglycosylase